jgi:hypothetical protein
LQNTMAIVLNLLYSLILLKITISSMETEHRKYETMVDIKTLGYIIGEGKNQEQPKIVVRENAVEVKMPRERLLWRNSRNI